MGNDLLRPIDQYFLRQAEPVQSCLQAMRTIILQHDPHITEAMSYGMPFYYYKGKRCCYLWVHKKYGQPYLGVVDGKQIEHPKLITEDRAKMKIMLVDPGKDLPVKTLLVILQLVVSKVVSDKL